MTEENQQPTQQAAAPEVAAPVAAPVEAQQAVTPVPAPAPAEPTVQPEVPTEPQTEVPVAAPAEAPAAAAPVIPEFNELEWNDKKKTINKTFVKGFSPRIFGYPFSLEIDVLRCVKAAAARGLQVVAPKNVMTQGGNKFLSTALLEVTGEVKPGDSGVVVLAGEYYCKVTQRGYFGIKKEIVDIQATLGGNPKEIYFWHASYPTYTGSAAKTLIIASTDVAPVPVKKAEAPVAPAPTPSAPQAPATPAPPTAAPQVVPTAPAAPVAAAPNPVTPAVPAQPAPEVAAQTPPQQ